MKIRYLWTIFMMVLMCFGGNNALAEDVPEIAEKALAATVYLEMSDTLGRPTSYGSGFFVSPTHIVTNFHVVAGAAKGIAKLVDKTKRYPIQGVVAADQENDLTILQVTIPGIKPLSLGDSEKVRIGEKVYVAGNPKGLEGTFSDGIISRISKQKKKRLQMTAPISPGSSGGPVLNSEGKVIGVAFMTIEGGQNLNFAIPSKYVKALLETKGRMTPLAQDKKKLSAEDYFNRGNTKFGLGLYESAILDYSIAIRLKSDSTEVLHNRALLHRGMAKTQLGLYFAAISDFNTAIRLKSDNTEAYAFRGLLKAKREQYFAAISDFDTAIRFNPDNALAYTGRGGAKVELGRTLEAKQDLYIALRLATQAGNIELKNEIERLLRQLK